MESSRNPTGEKGGRMNMLDIQTSAEANDIAWRAEKGREPRPTPEELLGAARFFLTVSAPRRSAKARAWDDAARGLWLAAQVLGDEKVPNSSDLGLDGYIVAQRAREWWETMAAQAANGRIGG